MTKSKKISVAEQVDSMMQRVALGVFLVSIAYAISAIRFFVSQESVEMLDIASRALGVLIIILVLPGFIKFMILKRNNRQACKEPEGFVVEMFNKATGKAFQFTFLFLVAFEFVNDDFIAGLPSEFVIKLILAVTLAIFSLTFFALSRVDEHPEHEDEFNSGENP